MKATIFWWSRLQNQTVLCGGCSSTCRFYASKCHLRRHRWILTTLKKIEEETSHTKKSAKYITISPYHLFLPLFGGCYISRYISWYKYINIIHTHTYIYIYIEGDTQEADLCHCQQTSRLLKTLTTREVYLLITVQNCIHTPKIQNLLVTV